MTFNNLIQMALKILKIALFTRATPGSSLVRDTFLMAIMWLQFCADEQLKSDFFKGMVTTMHICMRSTCTFTFTLKPFAIYSIQTYTHNVSTQAKGLFLMIHPTEEQSQSGT